MKDQYVQQGSSAHNIRAPTNNIHRYVIDRCMEFLVCVPLAPPPPQQNKFVLLAAMFMTLFSTLFSIFRVAENDDRYPLRPSPLPRERLPSRSLSLSLSLERLL